MDTWLDFYTPFFPSREATVLFVTELEDLDHGAPRHRAKILMHQTQRLVTLADDLETIRPGKQSLQLAFLIICCENVAKLFHNFGEDGQSKAYVRRFFNEFLVEADREQLAGALTRHDLRPLSILEIADTLYAVRCDVVHEGKYWGFHFDDGRMAMLNTDPDVNVYIQFSELRDIVVRGAIQAITQYAR
jgi:hypothetical protein